MPALPDDKRSRVRVIVLAAGAGRRMGRPKQLVHFEGRPLLVHAMEQARATGCPVDVVLGAETERCREILQQLAAPPRILVNENWDQGMAGSLQLGVRSAPPECAALFIALCDQPRIPREHFTALIDAWLTNPDSIIASTYAERIGAPCVFGRQDFHHLLELSGDRGARDLLFRERHRVQALPCPEAALDVDRPEDLTACEDLR